MLRNVALVVIAVLLAITITPLVLSQGDPGLQLKDLRVPSRPDPGSGSPPPDGTFDPKAFCPAVAVVYLLTDTWPIGPRSHRTNTSDMSKFAFIYAKPGAIEANRNAFLARLKLDNRYAALENELKTVAGRQRALDLVKLTLVQVVFYLPPDETRTELGIQNLTADEIDPFKLYLTLYKILDLASRKEFTSLAGTTSDPEELKGNAGKAAYEIISRIDGYGWPKLPIFVYNHPLLESSYTSLWTPSYRQYLQAGNWPEGVEKIGCGGYTPEKIVSASPLIYLYPSKVENISVNFQDPGQISTAYPVYSLIQGFKVKANGAGQLSDLSGDRLPHDYLYYEFLKDNINYEILNIKYQVIVAGDKLEEHLFHALLPKLSLIPQELSDYQEDIKKELITHHTSPITHYQVSLIQSSSLDDLIPLTVTPKPDTVIRNMIVVKKVETLTYPSPITHHPLLITHHTSHITHHTSPITHYSFPRQGFTLVENGVMALGE